MKVIAKELHCDAVTIFGTDIGRMVEAARYAASEGLSVWLQPRLVEGTEDEVLNHLAEAARAAEALRLEDISITLNIGCEHTLFMQGIFPGKTFRGRIPFMILAPLMPWLQKKLNNHLRRACMVARDNFKGSITYSSGAWEKVDWTLFDYVGVDYYRDKRNQKNYVRNLRKFHRHGKPVVITEFGCCAFKGADKSSGAGFLAINWKAMPPRVKPGIVRDEETQALYLEELISIYKQENVTGAFAFAFSEPSNPHTEQIEIDLDVASFGIVKVVSHPDPQTNKLEGWEPKAGFYMLAKSYAES
ncbi:MAG TPA: hypothetical protein VFZ58_01465 [Candidatus Saccharimonadales bacterium]